MEKATSPFIDRFLNLGVTTTLVENDLSLIAKALRENDNYSGVLDLDYHEFAKIYEYIPIMKNKANKHIKKRVARIYFCHSLLYIWNN